MVTMRLLGRGSCCFWISHLILRHSPIFDLHRRRKPRAHQQHTILLEVGQRTEARCFLQIPCCHPSSQMFAQPPHSSLLGLYEQGSESDRGCKSLRILRCGQEALVQNPDTVPTVKVGSVASYAASFLRLNTSCVYQIEDCSYFYLDAN